MTGDAGAIRNVYRSGLVNKGNHLDEVAIINHGGPDPGIAHDYSHAIWTRSGCWPTRGTPTTGWCGSVPPR